MSRKLFRINAPCEVRWAHSNLSNAFPLQLQTRDSPRSCATIFIKFISTIPAAAAADPASSLSFCFNLPRCAPSLRNYEVVVSRSRQLCVAAAHWPATGILVCTSDLSRRLCECIWQMKDEFIIICEAETKWEIRTLYRRMILGGRARWTNEAD